MTMFLNCIASFKSSFRETRCQKMFVLKTSSIYQNFLLTLYFINLETSEQWIFGEPDKRHMEHRDDEVFECSL